MIEENVIAYLHKLTELLSNTQVTDDRGTILSLDDGTRKAVELILKVKSTSKKAMLIGNGGSAAISSHMQNDLCKAVGMRAVVFNEPPLLTALTNDNTYERAFEQLVELWADTGDLLLAISSSGQSENILRAVKASETKACRIITFSGFKTDNQLRSMGHLNFYVPSQIYGYVEVAHALTP